MFGFASLAFIYAHQYVYELLGQPASIVEPIDPARLGVTVNRGPADEEARAGYLRHLRNSLAQATHHWYMEPWQERTLSHLFLWNNRGL